MELMLDLADPVDRELRNPKCTQKRTAQSTRSAFYLEKSVKICKLVYVLFLLNEYANFCMLFTFF